MSLKLTILVRQAPRTEWLTSGETYLATQARPGHDWRFLRADGAGTYVRPHVVARCLAVGSMVVVEAV